MRAMAGRSREAGGPVYVRWITWIWQGAVTRVIAELANRAVELGPLPADTDPCQIVADTLTYGFSSSACSSFDAAAGPSVI